MALKLPPYVHAFRDRHGKARYYFRRRGFRRAPLPGLPYSGEFMRAYEAAAQTVGEFGSSRSRPGTVAAAVAGLERLCQSGGEHAQGQAPDSGALPRPQRR